MTDITQATLIIFGSVNGQDPWHPLLPSEVPEYVKHPDTLGRLVAGEMCMDCADGPTGGLWYRAQKVTEWAWPGQAQ